MTITQRLLRRLRRSYRNALPRVLVLLTAALLVVTPGGMAARVIAACATSSGELPQGTAGGAIDEEEVPETAALPRSDVVLHRAQERRTEGVAWSGVVLRHRTEQDSVLVARRWERYQAPPRAPPHRLLN